MSDAIFVIHPDRKTQRTLQRVLGASGARLEILDSLEQAARLLPHHQPRLIIVDGACLLGEQGEAFTRDALGHGTEAFLTLLPAGGSDQLPSLLRHGAVSNLLVHPMPMLAEELTITAQKLLRRDIFGLEKYLLWGCNIVGHTFTRSSERAGWVDEFALRLRTNGQSPRVASMAMLVADELISNAIHNAPVDATGQAFRRDLARTTDFALDGRDQVTVRWACDARYLAIEVRDQYGTLGRNTILGALGQQEVRDGGGGAGMGMALTYRSCDHLIFNLHKGVSTEIIALLDVRAPPGDRPNASSYNIFEVRSA